MDETKELLAINTIRMLGMDAINKANSGHPGMVLGSAPTMYTLFNHFINATPKKSNWINRDRFVLASGHASMLLYSTLHLCDYKVSIDDIKNFRQLGSLTPGHPEYKHTEGIDATSGPLGQGIAHAVGMAMAEAHLAAKYNKDGYKIFDHYTYALCGDGDMQEGITQETISLAGHLKLNKLIVLYDANNVTLDGGLDLSFDEDVEKRFKACNWNVLRVNDANCIKDTQKQIKKAKKSDKPTLIIIKSIIGYMSSKQNTSKVHGSPLGEEDTNNIKKQINWNYKEFEVPNKVYELYKKNFARRGKNAYNKWKRLYKEYSIKYPKLYAEIEASFNNELGSINYPNYEIGYKEATRSTSGKVINEIAKQIPCLMGGAADVSGSVMTKINDVSVFDANNYAGQNINYGIREFAMSCAQTGMLLHGGIRSFIGSFLVFSDYFKASIRMASLMKIPAIYVLTHDSIAVGEDGPTHQPIEQVSSLRLIPNLVTFRPGNANETSLAWRYAIESKNNPVCLILSRQEIVNDTNPSYEDFIKGAYVASKEQNKADLTLLASGSELHLALDLQKELLKKGKDVRVVSLTSTNLFDKQSQTFKNNILGNKRSKVVAIEMGSPDLLYKYADKVIGISSFGKSGKAKDVINDFGFNVENLVNKL